MSSKRLSKFNSFSSHPWLHKSYRKLSKEEVNLASIFIEMNERLDSGAFELAVNRLFLDQPKKPKNWILLMELLSGCNR